MGVNDFRIEWKGVRLTCRYGNRAVFSIQAKNVSNGIVCICTFAPPMEWIWNVFLRLTAFKATSKGREYFCTGDIDSQMENCHIYLGWGSAPLGRDSNVFLPMMMVFPVVNALKRF